MKTVFTSHEIAHVWANKSAPYGRCPANMHFDSRGIFYSYNTAIARHIEHKGKPAVILNETHYSVSTSRHQSDVRSSLPPGLPIFTVDNQDYGVRLRFTGEELFAHYIQRAQSAEEDSRRPRIKQNTRDGHKGRAAHYLEQAREVAAFYGLRRKVDEKAIQRLATAKARAEKREAIARAKREEADRVKQQESYEAWKRGEDFVYGFMPSLFPHAFRIEGEELVSTLGARIPIEDARKAVRFAKLMRERGWHRNGEKFPVGMYQLDAVNAQGVVAGCHRVTWAEVERVEVMLSAIETVNA